MADRKELSWRSWVAIACLLLLVVYPLSIGPAHGVHQYLVLKALDGTTWDLRREYDACFIVAYSPLAYVAGKLPAPVGDALEADVRLWTFLPHD